jgi:hypothetical protein
VWQAFLTYRSGGSLPVPAGSRAIYREPTEAERAALQEVTARGDITLEEKLAEAREICPGTSRGDIRRGPGPRKPRGRKRRQPPD